MEDENTCYYYDAGTNHCRCYGKESLDALLAENARLKDEMRDLEAYDQILRDQLNQDNELRRIAESENAKLRELVKDMWPFIKEPCPSRDCCLFEECDADSDRECHVEEHMAARMHDLGIEEDA